MLGIFQGLSYMLLHLICVMISGNRFCLPFSRCWNWDLLSKSYGDCHRQDSCGSLCGFLWFPFGSMQTLKPLVCSQTTLHLILSLSKPDRYNSHLLISLVLIVAASWGSICRKGSLFSLFVTHSTPPQAFLVAQLVKNLPAVARDLGSIPGLGRSLEKRKATHSSILAWIIPWTV